MRMLGVSTSSGAINPTRVHGVREPLLPLLLAAGAPCLLRVPRSGSACPIRCGWAASGKFRVTSGPSHMLLPSRSPPLHFPPPLPRGSQAMSPCPGRRQILHSLLLNNS